MKTIKLLIKIILTVIISYISIAQINMIYEYLRRTEFDTDFVTFTQIFIVVICILMIIATWWKYYIVMGQIMKYFCYLIISMALFVQFFITGWTWFTKDKGDDIVILFWVYDLPLILSLFVLIFSYYIIFRLPIRKNG